MKVHHSQLIVMMMMMVTMMGTKRTYCEWWCWVVWVSMVAVSWLGHCPVWAAPQFEHGQGGGGGGGGGEVADIQLWLADEIFYDDVSVYDKPQGDQAAEQPTELCPPVPASLPDGSCHAQTCSSDRECGESGTRKCCYNGCIYTCLPELAAPAFLDWLREPRRRLSSGLSWLVTGPDEADEAEPCSTTPVDSDADPLLCPEGFFCSLYDEGDVTRGIPNQGLCVKLADDDTSTADSAAGSEGKEDSRRRRVKHEHACDLDGRMLLEGHAITRDGQQCICRRRKLTCEEQRDND
ncbi:uncharacterized protein LOC143287232 [Babylonia areolata]|uniref:uncharacterized protein LOC143287232 n=1 Tax=Babylonia areolata TaxID=304850 RepID=UPI003FD55AC3